MPANEKAHPAQKLLQGVRAAMSFSALPDCASAQARFLGSPAWICQLRNHLVRENWEPGDDDDDYLERIAQII